MEFDPNFGFLALKNVLMGLNLSVVRSNKEEINYFSLDPPSQTTVRRELSLPVTRVPLLVSATLSRGDLT